MTVEEKLEDLYRRRANRLINPPILEETITLHKYTPMFTTGEGMEAIGAPLVTTNKKPLRCKLGFHSWLTKERYFGIKMDFFVDQCRRCPAERTRHEWHEVK